MFQTYVNKPGKVRAALHTTSLVSCLLSLNLPPVKAINLKYCQNVTLIESILNAKYILKSHYGLKKLKQCKWRVGKRVAL